MQFSPARFNRHLSGIGQKFGWRRAAACPCKATNSMGSAQPDCPVCFGKGTSWGRVTVGQAGVVGAKAARQFADWARWEQGDVMLSVPSNSPLWAAGEHDRMMMLDSEEPFSLTLVRDELARVDFTVLRMDRCYWLADGELVDGTLPRIDPVTRHLTWPDPDGEPPYREGFVISGTKRPEYFVFRELPISRGHGNGLALPKKLLLSKFDLFGA
jgi:hypothetical protein